MLDNKNTLIIVGVYITTCTIAVISQSFVLYFFYKYIELSKNFAARLIFLLGMFDIFAWFHQILISLFRIIANKSIYYYSKELCSFSGFIFNFSLLMNMLFSFLICLSTFMEIIRKKNPEIYEKYFYLGIVSYSLLCSLFPFISENAYGDSDDFKCWLTSQIFDLLAFYIHIWIIFSINIFLMLKVVLRIRQIHFKPIEKTLIHRMMWIPIIVMIFWIEPSIRKAFYSRKQDFTLEILHYIFIPLQGFVNAIAYGRINDDIKEKIIAFFLRIKNKDCSHNTPTTLNSTIQNNFIESDDKSSLERKETLSS